MIGIFGGTFDPIHNGHLHVARETLAQLPFDNIHFIPCNQPVHREAPLFSANDRFTMVEIAVQHENNMLADEREIIRGGPSYMIDTLTSLRQEFPNETLCLMISMDEFLQFNSWKDWQKIVTVAHLIVINRSEYLTKDAPDIIKTWAKDKKITNAQQLNETQHGFIFFINIKPLDISATDIRQRLLDKKPLDKRWLPAAVQEFILFHYHREQS